MAKLRCQCGHKFLIDFERLTVQSARKVRCPECGLSFPLAEKSLCEPAPEVAVPTKPASPSIMATFTNNERPSQTNGDNEDDWPISIPLSELRNEPDLRNEPSPQPAPIPPAKPSVVIASWLAVLAVVLVLSTGAIFNGLMQPSTSCIVVTNLLLTGILFELWRIRRQLEN